MSKITNIFFKMDLKMFGNEKDFFTNAFEEAYNIGEEVSEPSDTSESVQNEVNDQIPNEPIQDAPEPNVEPTKELSKEEIKELYTKHFGEEIKEPEYDEETKSAIELYKYLEQNSHLVQAMRDLDAKGYQELNKYIPDEITKELNELKDFKAELEYKEYIKDLKSKYSDFDEDEVLKYAEEVDVLNLEVAYKAMKSEKVKEPNLDELREQIKKELLDELKQNSINTQSLVGGINQKPINNSDNVKLSGREERIARAMGLTPSEYAKWR